MKLAPTQEQAAALDIFRSAGNMAIEAGSGTGKTTTLVMLAEDAHLYGDRGCYVAFNRAIVQDGRDKFPRSVRCSTAHSLAFRAVGSRFKHRLDQRIRMPGRVLADHLHIEPFHYVSLSGDSSALGTTTLANYVIEAVRRFCHSADPALTVQHFPYLDGLDPLTDDGRRTYAKNNVLAESMLPAAQRLWNDAINERGVLRYEHDYYLKLWQISDPKIEADYILFDEAQDASPVLLAAVQAQKDAQLVFVGDSQQQIYEFTGAINALANVNAKQRTFLTESFRFGPPIAAVANQLLSRLEASLRLTGRADYSELATFDQKIESDYTLLTRTNAVAVAELIRLLANDENGLRPRPTIVGNVTDIMIFMRGAQELMERGSTSCFDLAGFKSWSEVEEYVRTERDGDDLKLMVKLIDQFGVQPIIEALNDLPPETRADVVISTAHKSKGREWDTVVLASDFNLDRSPIPPSELRLLYVAVTRAKRLLDVRALPSEYTTEEAA